MKAIHAYPHQGLDGLTLMDLPDPGDPGPTAIRVRVHATSLNFHDLGVVTGRLPCADGRIPMADGAGVVEAVGSEVAEFVPGDHVVSTFFPAWLDGEAALADFITTPGDGIDGFAREIVVAPVTSFTRAPEGLIVGSRRHQLDLIRGIDAVQVQPVIDRSFPLAEIADAFRLQESGGHFGKIVVEF